MLYTYTFRFFFVYVCELRTLYVLGLQYHDGDEFDRTKVIIDKLEVKEDTNRRFTHLFKVPTRFQNK